jgi:hypothetical protein
MPVSQAQYPIAKMTKVAEIVDLLGGFEAMEDGDNIVVTRDRVVFFDGDEDDGEGESPRIFGHALMPLDICRFHTRDDGVMTVWVSFDREEDGDVVHDPLLVFEVPLTGWRSGDWRPVEFVTGRGTRQTADTPEAAAEIAEYASGMDRESLVLDNALDVARRHAEGRRGRIEVPLDPGRAAGVVAAHFRGDDLKALVRRLADAAGYGVIDEDDDDEANDDDRC